MTLFWFRSCSQSPSNLPHPNCGLSPMAQPVIAPSLVLFLPHFTSIPISLYIETSISFSFSISLSFLIIYLLLHAPLVLEGCPNSQGKGTLPALLIPNSRCDGTPHIYKEKKMLCGNFCKTKENFNIWTHHYRIVIS